MKTKKCTKCGEVKELGEFVRHKQCKDERAGYCKKCDSILKKKYRESHREQIKVTYEKYRIKNKVSIAARKKVYRAEHRDERNKYTKDYVRERRGRDEEYRKRMDEKLRLRKKKYREELSDGYVRDRIIKNAKDRGLKLLASDISKLIVTEKRKQLKTRRYIRNFERKYLCQVPA